MAINTKAIKSRISSVKNTRKITRAMQMVAAAKMRKAVDAALSTREYATYLSEMMEFLSESENINHPLFEEREVNNVLLIAISSNRGLCGSFNSSVMNQLDDFLKNIDLYVNNSPEASTDEYESEENRVRKIMTLDDVNIDVIGLGRKAAEYAKKRDLNVVGVFEKMSENPNYEDVLPITNSMVEDFNFGKYDKVFVIYTNYVSALNQKTQTRQILPVSRVAFEQMIKEAGVDDDNLYEIENSNIEEYVFEPKKKEVLNYIIPRVIEMNVFQAVLESSASEHSSRMMAMKSATDAAGDLIDSLTLEFNKARQAAITQEISEIVGGAEAI